MKRILVIATRQIGDVLLTTPLIRAARERWPQAQIDVLGFPGTLQALLGNPDISACIEAPAKLGWHGMRTLAQQLWRRYDLALIAQPSDRAHLIGWVAAPVRSGIVPAGGSSNWWKTLLLRHRVVSRGDRAGVHMAPEKLALLAPWLSASAGAMPPAPRVVAPPAGVLPPAAQSLQDGAVVVHAPSMWPYKQWPLAHFQSLVRGLLDEGRQVVLTGTGAAHDQACVGTLRHLAPAPQLLDLSGQLDFNQLSALFARVALYIGPDTSITHLAAACGVQVISIFGPTDPTRWGPWPKLQAHESAPRYMRRAGLQVVGNVSLLQAENLSCVPCSLAGCENHLHSRSDCLQAIDPGRVLALARERLAAAAGG